MNSQRVFQQDQSVDLLQPDDSQLVAQKVFELLLEFGNFTFPKGELIESLTYAHHLNTIGKAIQNEAPLQFILPAFPAKSPNPKKTLNHLPDYGEVLALKRLNDFCSEVESFYSPGASVTICSDGRVFSDLVGVSDEHVNEYSRQIKEITLRHGFTHLHTFGLEDVLREYTDSSQMRGWLVEHYATPIQKLRERVHTETEFRALFNGIHRFLLEDSLALHPQMSKNKLRTHTKELSYSVIQRSNAWSSLLEEVFPHSIRLSIHPQPVSSNKIGVRLMNTHDIWRTPWHSVPLYNGSNYHLVSRQYAEHIGARLIYVENQYACYVTGVSL